jgi:hypothetical protein
LIRIQQSILLLADLAHTVLGMSEPLTQLWRPTIGLLRPLAQLVRHGVRIEQEVAHSSPDGLVDACCA